MRRTKWIAPSGVGFLRRCKIQFMTEFIVCRSVALAAKHEMMARFAELSPRLQAVARHVADHPQLPALCCIRIAFMSITNHQ